MGQYQKHVSRMQTDEVLYTSSEAAAEVGVSKDTLSRWGKTYGLKPSKGLKFGKNTVGLYTVEDILALKEHKKTRKLGRPPKDGS